MIMKIAGTALLSVFLVLILKQVKPEFAFLAQLGCGILLVSTVLPDVIKAAQRLCNMSGSGYADAGLPVLLIKIAAVTVVFQFISELCRDFGQGSLASNVEFAGKAAAVTMALPVLEGLVELVAGLVNTV